MKKNGERINIKVSPERVVLLLLVSLVVFQFIFQVSFLFNGTEYIVSNFTIDDTYYYLQTAWNLKSSGFSTFDQINQTNGFQLLWFFFIYIFALIVKSKTALLFLTLIICFLFNAGVYFFIRGIGRFLNSLPLMVFLSVLWFAQVLSGHYFFSGMENSLHAFLTWWIVYEFIKLSIQIRDKKKTDLILFSILLTLNFWTRLDSAVFSFVLFSVLLVFMIRGSESLKKFFSDFGKEILKSILIVFSGIIVQLMTFFLLGGSFLPVSAIIKTSGKGFALGSDFFKIFMEKLSLSFQNTSLELHPLYLISALFILLLFLFYTKYKRPEISSLKDNLKGWTVSFLLFILLAGISLFKLNVLYFFTLAALIILVSVYYKLTQKVVFGGFEFAWSAMLLGIFIYHIYLAGSRIGYQDYFFWYRSPFQIFRILTLGMIVIVVCRVKFKPGNSVHINFVVHLTSILIFIAVIGNMGKGFVAHPMLNAQYRTGIWIKNNIPEKSILASWNAGHIGYFSDRKVVNLDGLINSYEYYKETKKKYFNLYDYLKKNKVEYIVDYCCVEQNGLLLYIKPVKLFQTNKGWKPIVIWKLI